MKKTAALLLGVMLAVQTVSMVLPVSTLEDVFAEESVETDSTVPEGLEYKISGESVTITDYTGTAEELTIPSEIEGYPVTSIGDGAFFVCSLTSVTIPEGVTSIGDYAFGWCNFLTSVTIPLSVTSIGDRTFHGCSSLTGVTIPEGVTSISDYAFSACSSLTSVTIPEGVTSIGDYAFGECRSLASVTIPEGVTSIGESAFSRCSSLTEIHLPDSVATVGKEAFFDTQYYNDSTNWQGEAIYLDGWLLEVRDTFSGNYEIQEGTVGVAAHAFGGCISLTGVTIPSSVMNIGGAAFYTCTSLIDISVDLKNMVYCSMDGVLFSKNQTELVRYPGGKSGAYTIPMGVTSIDDAAFSECCLTDVTIPEGVTSISDYAFSACISLTSVTIPEGVTSIGDDAFWCCSSLTGVAIPEGVTSIGDDAFGGCSSLASVTIPEGVTSIGDYAFRECSSLTEIHLPDSVAIVGRSAFESTQYYNDGTNWQGEALYLDGWLLEVRDTFSGNYEIQEGTVGIAVLAFYGCTSLKEVTIPDSVETVGSEAFLACENLYMASIGSGVASIGEFAFSGCKSLKDVYYNGSESEWNAVFLGKGNDELLKAAMYFTSDPISVSYGDLDGDGATQAGDTLYVLKAVVKLTDLTAAQTKAADVDGNGKVEAADALMILKKVVNLIDSFPAEQSAQ